MRSYDSSSSALQFGLPLARKKQPAARATADGYLASMAPAPRQPPPHSASASAAPLVLARPRSTPGLPASGWRHPRELEDRLEAAKERAAEQDHPLGLLREELNLCTMCFPPQFEAEGGWYGAGASGAFDLEKFTGALLVQQLAICL